MDKTFRIPGRDPIALLLFMNESVRIPFELVLMGSWQATRFQLITVLDQQLAGMYELLLGDESLLTDTRAEFILYVETSEEPVARSIIDYLRSS